MTTVDGAAPLRSDTTNAPPGRGLSWLYLIGGAIGFIASSALMLEKIATLRNPDHVPTCSLNPVISCGSVMDSPRAELFGFPNPLLGIAAFAVVITVGVVLLSGFHPPRWFWLGMQVGTTLGVLLVHWLIYQSLYEIAALCPYCMMVWVVTIPMFWYTTLSTLGHGHLAAAARPVAFHLARVHTVVLALWYVSIAVLILQAFWSYWTTLL